MIYDTFLDEWYTSFDNAICKYYNDFVVIGSPIISRDEVNILIDTYKDAMHNQLINYYEILGFKDKANLSINKHLRQSG